MNFKVVCVAVLFSISVFARANVLDDFESALIAGDYAKAREGLIKTSSTATAAQVRGYTELVRVFESCETFIALADQYMIAPSSTPIKKLESAYDAIGFKENNFAVSTTVVDLLNEKVQRAGQLMEFAHRGAPPVSGNNGPDREAQANQEQALRTACGMDYRQLKLGMTLDRVRMCVGTPYLVNVVYRRGMLTSTYKIDQRYVQVLGYQVIGWVK